MLKNILKTPEEIESIKYNDFIPMQCPDCNSFFNKLKKEYTRKIKNNPNHTFYCSQPCVANSQRKRVEVECQYCSVKFIKKSAEIKKTKNNFCNKKCHMSYCNKNKITGTTRSKIELRIEKQLQLDYPQLTIIYSDRSLGLELDIYIPSLNLAFEIQGIFHYEPIFGQAKLDYIQENDKRKKKLCKDNSITLVEIDISKFKYITADRFKEIYTQIIQQLQ